MLKLLLDTNVFMDYLLGREPGCSAAKRILSRHGEDVAVYAASLSLKDVFYLVTASMKRQSRMSNGGVLADSAAAAATEVGWACVRKIMELTILAPVGASECLMASTYRPLHDDFEDNLIVATAQSIDADYLVTGDEALLKHCPVAALSPEGMVALLDAR